jgi:hypothetical protein
MSNSGFKNSPFQHALIPIICIGMSDGNYTKEELEDLKSTAVKLAVWFQITPEQAWKECEELYNYISEELSNSEPRFIFLRVPISCAITHKNLKSIEARDYLIQCLEAQATADGVLSGDELQLIHMYSKIIHQGGESVGINV